MNIIKLQAFLYVCGSFCFTAGSSMYFDRVFQSSSLASEFGGWLFTFGGLLFILADLYDWWNKRTGYCSDGILTPPSNIYGSIIGTSFYFAGCILFLPIFEDFEVIGEWFFIFGASFAIVSLSWKNYRIVYDHSFDIKSLLMDIFNLIGNLSFFIGTFLFLPFSNKNDSMEDRAASLFVFGSSCFVISSMIFFVTSQCPNRDTCSDSRKKFDCQTQMEVL